ncbi:HD domain-containing protein [Leifsonia sp. PS1209]|uniref:HD domain-containing protein n=1 Tax=Leifsonia sp. PS1209 TaxID=2724914 RepID=UPI001442C92B|nr:HD domain-containing protein [Leifsonia sp. PS1209]QIZ98134.1 cyanamide hydratase [Leifsonia sp. PS1209]
MRLADFTPPDTQAARAAYEFAAERQTPALLNHCIRSWLWALGFAELDGGDDIDHELLYVAALLHDLGLVEEFDNVTLSYEDAGGHVAAALTAGAGWPAERRTRVHEVIVRHNWPTVDPALDAEGHLLEIATGLDISGVRADLLPLAFREEVLAAFPRLSIAAEFGACVTDQAARKPTTQAARIVANGVVRKLAENPLEALGA